ncbi:MAG TPA: hypothetical protein VKA10_12010 [Prolixibacteraceae bacterium]|nr:hypothetical protein [Prolixibacteraceae bacterium]
MRYVVLLLFILTFASCHNYKNDAERLEAKVDSLQNVADQKDETIEVFVSDFSDIQANLDSIKKIEELLAVPEQPEQAISDNRKARIVADISAINSLLQENKEIISSLRRRINNSNFKTGKLESMVNELEQLTKNLEENVKRKDMQIETLTEKVEEQTENLSMLNERISTMENLSQQQLDSIKLQEAALNKAYYTFGEISELKESNIVEREGGILGIGSTPVVREDFPQEGFTEVDLRDFEYLPLNARKADVISVHPIGSYHISGENNADTLFIDNPAKFWSASKYLVVVTK